MKQKLLALSVLMVFLLGACNGGQKTKKNGSDEAENDSILVTKTYHPGGGLWKVNRGKKVEVNGKTQYVMEGEVLEYYKTPKNALSSKAIYKDGKRNGPFYKYYTDGKLYYEVPYVDGKMNGIKKSYHENGNLMAETPYKQGLIGVGTKEYTTEGKLLEPMTIKVWYKKNGSAVTVYAQVLNKGKVTKRAQFFNGYLIEGTYYHKNLQKVPMKDGLAKITLQDPPSYVVISAKAKSARNNYTFLTKGINIE